jgi:glycosyltransferase involved in cell wall biosynthesis
MNILHCIDSINPALGGPVEAVKQFADVAAKAGITMEVLTLDESLGRWADRWPVKVTNIAGARSSYRVSARYVRWLSDNAHRFQAIVTHGLWKFSTIAPMVARGANSVPCFVIPHGMLNPWLKAAYPWKHVKKWIFWHTLVKRMLRRASAVVFLCEEEVRLANETFSIQSLQREILPLGLGLIPQVTDEEVGALKAKIPSIEGKRVVLFLGRLCLMKGCDLFVEALGRFHGLPDDVHFVMAGPDEDNWQAKLQRRAAELGVGDKISWPGPLYGREKFTAFCLAEAFILPSHCETFPIAILEALASSVPVLTTHHVNIWREIHQDNACMVDDDSIDGTHRLISRWLKAPQAVREEMRQAAYSCYLRRFEAETALRAHVKVYERYIGGAA